MAEDLFMKDKQVDLSVLDDIMLDEQMELNSMIGKKVRTTTKIRANTTGVEY